MNIKNKGRIFNIEHGSPPCAATPIIKNIQPEKNDVEVLPIKPPSPKKIKQEIPADEEFENILQEFFDNIGTTNTNWQKHILRIPIPGASHTNVQKLCDFLNSTLKHQITAIDHVFDPDSSSKDLIVSPPRLEKRIKRHVPSSPPPVPKESQLSSPPRIADVKKELNKGQKVIVPSSPPKTVDKNVQKLDEGNKKIKLTQDQPKQEKYVAQPNNEGKIKTNENVPSQKPLKTDGQKVEIKNEKSQIKGEKVITTPTPTKIEKDRKDPEPKSLEKIENDRIKKTIVTPVITTPFFSLGLAEIEEEENNKTNKEEEEIFLPICGLTVEEGVNIKELPEYREYLRQVADRHIILTTTQALPRKSAIGCAYSK
uniref:Uncharacterized protein n=1 Tax=Meloidogyne floridensis TaxID=298350 RepID=A0A915NSJ5_9BILA